MYQKIDSYWYCHCDLCEQLMIVLKGCNVDISPDRILFSAYCIRCGNSRYGTGSPEMIEILKQNKREIALLASEQELLCRYICDELKSISQYHIRLSPNQIREFKKYCTLKDASQKELPSFLMLLQYDFQVLINKGIKLLDNDGIYEFLSLVGAYIHEQEFVKAYIRFVNEGSRKTWAMIRCG